MAYKRKQKKSLLLYYDYKDQFEMLTDEQLRKLIYAMIEYDKNDVEIELDKITKMAFVPIKRKLRDDKKEWNTKCNINSENGKKSHQKNELTTVNDRQQMVTKLTDIDSDSDNDNEKDKDKDSVCVINNTPLEPPHDTNTIFDFALTLDENYEEKSLKASCKKFFNYYKEKNWEGINNWQDKLEFWLNTDLEKGILKLNQEDVIEYKNGFKYVNGKRML